VVDGWREAFRLEPAVFITEHYGQFRRKVDDFAQTLALFAIIGASTAVLAGSFAASLLHDVYADRRRQYAMLLAIGFSPMQTTMVSVRIRFWLPRRFVLAGFRGALEKMLSPTRDRGFESSSLQRGVRCEPDFRGEPLP